MKLVKRLIAICCAAIMAVSAAACGANVDSRTEITVWSWEPSMKQVIASFEKENPDIHVIWKNTSGYDNLNNAIQDGYGIPRRGAIGILCVAPVRGKRPAGGDHRAYGRLRRFLHARYVGFGAAERPRIRPSHGFRSNGVLLQRQRVRAGSIDASKIRTWDDYYEAAKKLKSIGVYITADSGDASFYDTMIWLAGGRPFSTSTTAKKKT